MDNRRHPPKPLSTFLFWLAVHGFAIGFWLVAFIGVVPAFDQMFMEFGLKLPLLSVLLINLSRIFMRYGLVLIPTAVFLDIGMLCLLFLGNGMPRRFRLLWCYGTPIVSVVLFLLIVVGMLLPLLGLIQGLS